MKKNYKCKQCKCYKDGWCCHFAAQFVPEHPVCEYGHKQIVSVIRAKVANKRWSAK